MGPRQMLNDHGSRDHGLCQGLQNHWDRPLIALAGIRKSGGYEVERARHVRAGVVGVVMHVKGTRCNSGMRKYLTPWSLALLIPRASFREQVLSTSVENRTNNVDVMDFT